MGQACCTSHDKTGEQQIVTQPHVAPGVFIPDPFSEVNADAAPGVCIPDLFPEVDADYILVRPEGGFVDIVHISTSNGIGRMTSLGPLGSGDVRWEGQTMIKHGSTVRWQYQDNGEFQDEGQRKLINVTAYWERFQESELNTMKRTGIAEARLSFGDTWHGKPLDQNPYVRTSVNSPLGAALANGTVRLVRGYFLKNCWEERQPWPMRQSIPESGFWPTADAFDMWRMYGPVFFLALSYSWLHPTLNDPNMWHLERVARLVDEFHASSMARFLWFRAKGVISSTATNPPEDIGFFIDFCSLPQQNPALGIVRSEEEQQQFVAGLAVADCIYGHVATTVIRLTSVPLSVNRKYELRGWTSFEESVSNAKPGYHFRVFTFGDTFSPEKETSHGIEMLDKYMRGNLPPQTPQQFAAKLQGRRLALQQSPSKLLLFSNPEDETLVLNRYYDVWAQVSKCDALAYRHVGWGEAEALQLASVFPSFVNLKSLVVTESPIGSKGLLAIFSRVPSMIEELTITMSSGTDAAYGIAAELPRLTGLRVLDLSSCNFGDEGVQAMARQMPSSLQHLELIHCGFKECGAIAIGQLLSHLRILVAGLNDLSGKGIDAFVEALYTSPIERLILFESNVTDEEEWRVRSAWAAAQKQKDQLIIS